MTDAELEQLLQNEETMMLLGIGVLVVAAVIFIGWLLTLYPRYYMTKKSGVGSRVGAFVPIWQDMQLFKIAGWKSWYYWIFFAISLVTVFLPNIVSTIVSILSFVLYVVLAWKISGNFGLGTAGKILAAIPCTRWFVYWYIALKKKEYNATTYNNLSNKTYGSQNNANKYQPQPRGTQDQNWR